MSEDSGTWEDSSVGKSSGNQNGKRMKKKERKSAGPRFLLNRSGVPLSEEAWDRMFNFYNKEDKQLRYKIEEKAKCKKTKYPTLPKLNSLDTNAPRYGEVSLYLCNIKGYFNQLEYNHTGTQIFEISKLTGFSRLMEKAKFIIRCSMPIKCLEATVVGMYLTCFIPKLIRFPITFKSVCQGQSFYHIVLGIYYEGQLGSIGLSRRDDLADKPLIYDSLAALVREFQQCYAGYCHKLQKVTIGGPVPTDLTSQVQVQWNKKKFTLNSKCDWNSMSRLPRSFKRDEESKSKHSFGQPRSMEALLSMIKLDTSKSTASPMTIRPATQFAPKRANGSSRVSLNAPTNSSRLAAAYSKPQARARLFKSVNAFFFHK
ncbi:unnamed protein product [Oikopleura dioica]|uniref:Vasohibin-like protein n=1 Tax=Oikopleura dioica TaxID=34765 RepID=E4X003_OIKDI|nr:unnamed protein product [Oikopleura dioica]